MIAEVFTKRFKNRYYFISEQREGFDRSFIEWREVTVKIWNLILNGKREKDLTSLQLDSNILKYCVLDTNLVEIERRGEYLTDLCVKKFLSIIPGTIPKILVRNLKQTVYLTNPEVEEINKQCSLIFRDESVVENPNPYLEKALIGMSMKERFSIPLYANLDDIPQKTFTALRVISNNYAELLNQKGQRQKLRQEAKKLAGWT